MKTPRLAFIACTVLAFVLSAHAGEAWMPAPSELTTPWTKDVCPTNALPEYPRPTQERKDWQNLNGLWDYAVTGQDVQGAPSSYDGKILVPYPYESALSGVGKPSIPNNLLWYHRTFTIPADWNVSIPQRPDSKRVLLNFGAVDWDAAVYVNGTKVGTHRGCYTGFSFDITPYLKTGENDLVVSALNPIKQESQQVKGKQRLKSGGMMYRASTGIWQTVWLEPVPSAYITQLKITPDVDFPSVRVSALIEGFRGKASPLTVTVLDDGKVVGRVTGSPTSELVVPIKQPRLWSLSDPHLYELKISLDHEKDPDQVQSYFGLRKVSLGKNEKGQTQILINGKFVFEVGALDQGYWPDGIYTAPIDEALRFDIQAAKDLKFNLLRKHAKVEPERWYYWADKIGMLVWQDMPQAFVDKWTDEGKAQFELEWRRELAERYNHPSIIVWVPFNEGWGQHDTRRIVEITRQFDSSRLINEGSGWENRGWGDMNDIHPYPMPLSVKNDPDKNRRFDYQALAVGETGGLSFNWPTNSWQGTSGQGWQFRDLEELVERYQRVLFRAYHLAATEGLSAVVYTQLTDVEYERNGVLTYDRQINKIPKAIVIASNSGKFSRKISTPHLVPNSLDSEPQEWRYTTEKPADSWTRPDFDDSGWKTGLGTFGLVGQHTHWKGFPKEPDLWIRRKVQLPQSIPAKLDLLLLCDDGAEVYLNGVKAGSYTRASDHYVRIAVDPAARATLRPGENIIAAHAYDTLGACGLDVGVTESKAPSTGTSATP